MEANRIRIKNLKWENQKQINKTENNTYSIADVTADSETGRITYTYVYKNYTYPTVIYFHRKKKLT